MNSSMINSLMGMHALQQRIDTISNNISNINTIGYKSREAIFSEILTSRLNQPDAFNLTGRTTTMGLDQGYGSNLSLTLADFSQGQPLDTGLSTDFMLMGKNIFFTIRPQNADYFAENEINFTRDGHFQLNVNRELVTENGDFVLDSDNDIITIPEGASFEVDPKGRILAYYPNGEVEEAGNLKITKIDTPQVLESLGNNLYKVPDKLIEEGIEVIDLQFDFAEDTTSLYSVIQGNLESSNTDLAKELVQLNQTLRNYQFLSDGISISDQMLSIANKLTK